MFISDSIRSYYVPWPWLQEYYPQINENILNIYKIRLFIFLITGVCVGFPALIWAIYVLYQHNRIRCQVSPITIYLIICDLLELILNPVLVVLVVMSLENDAVYIARLLIGVRLCGHQFHQLVALEYILTAKYPSLAHFFSPSGCITLCIVVWLVGTVCQFIPGVIIYLFNIFLCVLPVIVCAVTCLMTCKASPDTNQPTEKGSELLVLSVAMFTLFILYGPFFVTLFTGLPFMLDCVVSMRLISEPILCVLICRETHMVTEAHSDSPNESIS